MNKKIDYTTLSKYFTIPKDFKTILNEIDSELIKVIELIDEAIYSDDGTDKEPTENNVTTILNKLQKLINKYNKN
jgi:hypothetical protein